MVGLKGRYLIVVIMMALTTFAIYALRYDFSYDKLTGLEAIRGVPLNFGKWRGQDVQLEEMVYEILETRAIIHRSYTSDNGNNVFLSIVHYHDTKVDFHAPEACIGGRGLKTKKTTKVITLFPGADEIKINMAEMITTRPSGRTLTYYFFKSGQFVGSNYIKMRLNIAMNKLANNNTSGSLVRISTDLTTGNKDEASYVLTDFWQDIFPHLQQAL